MDQVQDLKYRPLSFYSHVISFRMDTNGIESKTQSNEESTSTGMNSAGASDCDDETASFSALSSEIRSSDLNAVSIDNVSLQSDTGCCVLDWRAEMTPGTVSLSKISQFRCMIYTLVFPPTSVIMDCRNKGLRAERYQSGKDKLNQSAS